MGSVLLGLVAGILTTLSPCILPILPIVVLAAVNVHRYGPLAMVAGLAFAFTAAGLLVAGAISAFDISDDSIRIVSASLLMLFGLILMSSVLRMQFAAFAAPLAGRFNETMSHFAPTGLWGQFAVGALLGAVWTPCSGPTLGAALTLAANSETMFKSALVMLFFSVGASLPLLAIAYGSRQTLLARRASLAEFSRRANPFLGIMLMGLGIMILVGFDRVVQAALVNAMPDWLLLLTTRF